MTSLIGNEWRKLLTIRSPLLLLAAAQALVIAGVVGFLASKGVDAELAGANSMAHLGVASIFPLVLGVTAVAGEYRHRTITETFLAAPRRSRVVVAKLLVYSAAGLGFGLAGTVTALVSCAAWFASKGASFDWLDTEVWRTLLGGIGWNVAFAAIGVGLGALIRTLAGALVVALAWIAVVEGIVGQLLSDLRKWLPFSAGAALGRASSQLGDNLSQSTAAGVLAGYVVVFAVCAVLATAHRDVP
jgi:ABC-2 type transport system permease protein